MPTRSLHDLREEMRAVARGAIAVPSVTTLHQLSNYQFRSIVMAKSASVARKGAPKKAAAPAAKGGGAKGKPARTVAVKRK